MFALENLDQSRLMIDVALFILIWLVQLIIYPSFRYCSADTFTGWHYRYTGLISIFVAPLMFGQTGVYAALGYTSTRWHDIVGIGLLGSVWAVTFLLSIPCHDRLQKNGYDLPTINRLVATNWPRTVAWSAMLAIDFYAGIAF